MKKKLKKRSSSHLNAIRYFSTEYVEIYVGTMYYDWFVASCYEKCRV